jgi:hypothetical protein
MFGEKNQAKSTDYFTKQSIPRQLVKIPACFFHQIPRKKAVSEKHPDYTFMHTADRFPQRSSVLSDTRLTI